MQRQMMGVEAYPDPLERLRQGGRAYIRFALSEPEYYHLMFGTNCEQVDLEGEWAASSMASYNNFRATVEQCVGTGHFGAVDVDTVVFALWSGVHGLAHLLSTGQVDSLKGETDFESLLDDILDFWMRPGTKNT